jgi:phenylpropionate dioxygenase-like ring-hydroxylating dioxygenase large terminal subunit
VKELDHWHPVALSEEVGREPRAIELLGRPIVLFRTGWGEVGALIDRCPHRGMVLSKGWVDGARLVCPYHGWSYDVRGNGFCPATPSVHACAESFETKERYGAIWIRRAGASTAFPELGRTGFVAMSTMMHRVERELELVLDNFVEVEHTPTTHWLLGYAPEKIAEVKTEVDVTETAVRVHNRGPQKRVPKVLMRLFDIHEGDHFIDDWTTYFSPVHCLYTQYWIDAETDRPRRDVLLTAAFFVPRREAVTDIFTFLWANRARRPIPHLIVKPILRYIADQEVRRDQKMIEQLAPDVDASLDGLRLGRFDSVLRQNRRRIDRIYRGRLLSAS